MSPLKKLTGSPDPISRFWKRNGKRRTNKKKRRRKKKRKGQKGKRGGPVGTCFHGARRIDVYEDTLSCSGSQATVVDLAVPRSATARGGRLILTIRSCV